MSRADGIISEAITSLLYEETLTVPERSLLLLILGAARSIETRTAAFTAEVGGRYIVEAAGLIPITDPAGSAAGQSYEVWIGSGSINYNGAGQVYASSRFSIRRRYTGTAWATPDAVISGALAANGQITTSSFISAGNGIGALFTRQITDGISATGIGFATAGQIEINNGTIGTLRDITLRSANASGTLNVTGDVILGKTITAAGTTGARTITQTTGRVNFAAAASSLVVTNTLCTVNSVIECTIATNDTTAAAVKVVASAGSFTIHLGTAPTAETAINFTLTN